MNVILQADCKIEQMKEKSEKKSEEKKSGNDETIRSQRKAFWSILIGIGVPVLVLATGFLLNVKFPTAVWFCLVLWFLVGIGVAIYFTTDSALSVGGQAFKIIKLKKNRAKFKSEIELANDFGRMYLKCKEDRTAIYFAIKSVLTREPGSASAILAFEVAVDSQLDWMTEIPTHANADRFFPGLVGEKSTYGTTKKKYVDVPHLAAEQKRMRELLMKYFIQMKKRF